MTKRILVALDPDADTPVATRHALRIAERREGASVTGLAVIDAGHVETDSRGGSLGGVYHTAAMQQGLTTEAQNRARRLLKTFSKTAADAGAEYEEHVRQGMPFHQIVGEMRFHDLLVMGETPHYFYSQPDHQTKTLSRVVRDTQAPTLVVREDREPPVERVLVAFDGGNSSVRTLQAFAQLQPFGTDVAVTLLHVHDDLPAASARLLERASEYLHAHGFDPQTVSVEGTKPHEVIDTRVREEDVDVVVAGARSVSRLRWLTFGSNTAPLLEGCPAALFLYH